MGPEANQLTQQRHCGLIVTSSEIEELGELVRENL